MRAASLIFLALFVLLAGAVYADTCYPSVQKAPVTCSGSITTDSWDGCRKVECSTSSGTISTLACDKGAYFEVYRQSASGAVPTVCYGSTCINSSGYAKGNLPVCTQSSTPTCTPTTEVCDGRDNNCDGQIDENNVCATSTNNTCYNSVKSMPATCTGGTITSDVVSGGRTIVCSSGGDNMQVQAWDKTGYFEMYKQQQTGSAVSKICIGDTCITNGGYAKSANFPICTQTSGTTTPPPNNQTNTTQPPNQTNTTNACYSSVKNIPVTCTSTITGDTWNGCRQVVCGTSTNNIKALACDKGSNFEVYKQAQTGAAPKVCFGNTCIQKDGYTKSSNFPICMQSTTTNQTNTTQPGTGNITVIQEYSKEHNQVMVCNLPTVNATSYTWTVNGAKVFEKNLSSYGYYKETFSHYLHAFPGNGTYTIGCTGTDDQGKTESASRTLTITTRATTQEIQENPTVVRTSAQYTGNYTANVSCTVIGVADPTAFFLTTGGYSDANGSISTDKRGYGSTINKDLGQFERMEALPGKGTYTLSCRGAVMNENMARFYQNAGQGIGFGCFGGARGGDPVCETNTKSTTVSAPFEASTKNGQIEVTVDPQNTTRFFAIPRISYADHWYCQTPSGSGYSSAGTPVGFTSTQDTATISCSYDDGSTGSGWGQDASISNVVNLAALRQNSTPTQSDDPGSRSTLRFVRATLNGQTLTPQNRTLYTTPGAPVTGTITFAYTNAWPQGIGMTWGYTTHYTEYTSAYSGAQGAMQPSGEITMPVNTVAPDYRMADYLILAYRAEKAPVDLFSMTNWARSSGPVWFDGNDIAGWSPRIVQQAMSTGRVQGEVLFENQYKQLSVPSDAVIINTGQIEKLNETFNDGDYTRNPTWSQAGMAGGMNLYEVVNGELHMKRVNAYGDIMVLELRSDIPVTDKTTVSIDSRKVFGSASPVTITVGAYTNSGTWEYMNVPVASTTSWTRNQEFNVKQYIPDAYRINWIRITTGDHDMEAYVDNFSIYEK